jgi:hypothetical protein
MISTYTIHDLYIARHRCACGSAQAIVKTNYSIGSFLNPLIDVCLSCFKERIIDYTRLSDCFTKTNDKVVIYVL